MFSSSKHCCLKSGSRIYVDRATKLLDGRTNFSSKTIMTLFAVIWSIVVSNGTLLSFSNAKFKMKCVEVHNLNFKGTVP